MVKRKFLALMILLLFLLQTGIGTGMVLAAGPDDLKITASANPSQLEGAGTVKVTMKLENVTDEKVTGVVVHDASGDNPKKSIGEINSGVTAEISFDYSVRENELNKDITFMVKWDGNPQGAPAFVKVQKAKPTPAPAPSVKFTRTADKEIAAKNEEVTFTYTVENTGNVDVQSVKIEDKALGGNIGWVDNLAVGNTKTFTRKIKISKDLTSKPTLSYTAGGDSYSGELDPLTVKLAKASMTVDLKADKDEVKVGERVTLTCTLKNTGNVDFTDLNVSDDMLGDVLKDKSLPVGKTSVVTKVVTIDKDQTFTFRVKAKDALGNPFSQNSKPVTVSTILSSEQIRLGIEVSANVTELQEPGTVSFDIVVTNYGEAPLKDVVVEEKSLGEVGRIEQLEMGDKLIKKTIELEETTVFVFKVRTRDAMGNEVVEESAPVEITVGASTPEETEEAIEEPEATEDPEGEEGKESNVGDRMSILFTILGIIAFLIIAAGIALVILVVQEKRAKAKAKGRSRRRYRPEDYPGNNDLQ
ncbi:MAG: DUF7507 domain-containing protein [Clostridia bacterium]